MNVPKLRFPAFVGEWEKKKVVEISEKINSGKTPLGGESVYVEEGILFIRSQNVLDNKLSYENSTFIPEEINNKMINSVVKARDILLNITGASLGRSCVVPLNFSTGNVNQHVCIIRINKKNDPYFIQPIFSSEKGQNLFTSIQTGSGREGLNFQSIKQINLFLPTLPEQTLIATFLTTVDSKLTHLKKKKTLLDQYKNGVMQKIFTQKMRFKDDYGNKFPDWENKKLGELTDFIKNGVSFNQNNNKEGYKVTRIETISDKCVNIDKVGYVKTNQDISDYKLLVGDMLFSNINSVAHIGKIAFIDKDYNLYHGMNLLNIRINKAKNCPNFYFYQLTSRRLKKHFEEICNKAVNQASINQTDLKKTKLLAPSLSEQTKIANFLSAIDEKINYCSTQIEKTALWKKGLLQKMFV